MIDETTIAVHCESVFDLGSGSTDTHSDKDSAM